jgi:hypothetical protein
MARSNAWELEAVGDGWDVLIPQGSGAIRRVHCATREEAWDLAYVPLTIAKHYRAKAVRNQQTLDLLKRTLETLRQHGFETLAAYTHLEQVVREAEERLRPL